MAAYPGALAVFAGFTATHTLAADNHAAQHNLEQGEILAAQTKIGTGASTPTNGTVLRGTGAGTSSWAQVGLTTDVTGVLPIANGGNGTTSTTGSGSAVFDTSPTISGANLTNSPTLSTPNIADLTNAVHTHASSTQGGQLNGANAITNGTITPAELDSSAGTSWAWQSWTPTFSNITAGNGTHASKYIQVGKTIIARIEFTFGSTSAMGSNPTFTLPITGLVPNGNNAGNLRLLDSGVASYFGFIQLASTATAGLVAIGTGGSYASDGGISSTVPFSWGDGDGFYGTFIYEAA